MSDMTESILSMTSGKWGDYPIKGTSKVTAPAGFYFAYADVISDATMTAMEVSTVANTSDSYFNKVLPAPVCHPFTAKITAITLSAGELHAWLKPL